MPVKKVVVKPAPKAAPAAKPATKAPVQKAAPAKEAPKDEKKSKSKDYIDRMKGIITAKLGKQCPVSRASERTAHSEIKGVIPTGIDVIDHHVIGRGGLLRGRMIEVFGGESSGKTALVLRFIAAVQMSHPDAIANLVEPEQSFEANRAEDFGVDTDRLLLSQPYSREDTRDIIISSLSELPDNGPPSILVWDSVDSGPPESELEAIEKDKKAQPGVTAKMNALICRNAIPLAARKRCILVFVNQVRSKIGVAFGDPDTTPGGRAIPFYAAVRLQLWGAKAIKVGDTAYGRNVTVKAIKNKVAPPWRKASLKLDFGLGWDNEWSTLKRAKDLGLIDNQAKGREAVLEAKAKLDACKWGLTLGNAEDAVPEADEDGYDASAPHPDDLPVNHAQA